MPQIELPKLRRHGDLFFNLTLADGGVQVSWDSVIIMQLFMYSEKQRGFAGRCSFEIDQADPHTLRVKYPYGSQRFLGIHRVVVQVELAGAVKTYDARVCNIVASTSDTTVDYDTVLDVPITVSDVDTTIMHEILEACVRATAEANEAAEQAREAAEAAVRRNAYDSIDKIEPNLYEVNYGKLDYEAAKEHFENLPVPNIAGCSAIIRNGIAGRNYDWHNNKAATFVIHTPSAQGHLKVIGVAGGLDALTVAKVESRDYAKEWEWLPFYLVDGENDEHLFAEVNVVPASGNTRTVPAVEMRESICSLMLVRYILDNFATVDEAVDYIDKYVEVYFPQALLDMGYETHWMLRDEDRCTVLEIVGDSIVTVDSDLSTNFHISGVSFNADGSVYTNSDAAEGHLPTEQGVDLFGKGLERWNILNAGNPADKGEMRELMQAVLFSNAYSRLTEVWYSEFTGGAVTVDTLPADPALQDILLRARQAYEEDSDLVDITVHSVVYDLARAELEIRVQERNTGHVFSLERNTDFDLLTNRPSYNGMPMNGGTEIPEVKTEKWDGMQVSIVQLKSRLDCIATTYPMGEGVKVYEDVIITEINP